MAQEGATEGTVDFEAEFPKHGPGVRGKGMEGAMLIKLCISEDSFLRNLSSEFLFASLLWYSFFP